MLDWFTPAVVEIFHSQVSGKIEIRRFQGQFSLYVNNCQQSGPWMEKIWSRGLKTLKQSFLIKDNPAVLLLGLGTGSMIKLLVKYYPLAKITGLEIDPLMVTIGKKYFGLEPKQLKIIFSDASNVHKIHRKFDLIIVDLFDGENVPEVFQTQKFFSKLYQKLSKSGRMIFNVVTTQTTTIELEKFVDNLEKSFKINRRLKIDFNLLFICSRR